MRTPAPTARFSGCETGERRPTDRPRASSDRRYRDRYVAKRPSGLAWVRELYSRHRFERRSRVARAALDRIELVGKGTDRIRLKSIKTLAENYAQTHYTAYVVEPVLLFACSAASNDRSDLRAETSVKTTKNRSRR